MMANWPFPSVADLLDSALTGRYADFQNDLECADAPQMPNLNSNAHKLRQSTDLVRQTWAQKHPPIVMANHLIWVLADF